MHKVSIIIVNYKTAGLTLELVKTLFSMYKEIELAVYVVENSSPDNSFSDLVDGLGFLCRTIGKNLSVIFEADGVSRLNNADVCIFKSCSNDGFASGNNKILKLLIDSSDTDYVWLLNPDAFPSSTALQELIGFTCDSYNVLVGSVLFNGSKVQCVGGSKIYKVFGIPKGLQANIGVENLSLKLNGMSSFRSLDFISGASMFFSIKTLKVIGLMPEEYFLYWEEADWCEQARRKGVVLDVCVRSIIEHKVSASVGLRSYFQYRIDMRNSLIFARKYYRGFIVSILLLKPFINLFSFIKKERKFSFMPLLASWRGAFDFFRDRV